MLGRVGASLRTRTTYAIGNLLGAVGALSAGTTTLVDWSHIQNTPAHSDAAVAALRADAGIRGVFAHGWPWWSTALAGQQPARAPAGHPAGQAEYFASDDQLLTLAMAARGPEEAAPGGFEADLRLARELGIRDHRPRRRVRTEPRSITPSPSTTPPTC